MSKDRRLRHHPVLEDPLSPAAVPFTFDGRPLWARPGEVVTSALHAAGIVTLGHHARDAGPQGLFCANGQCSQCLVVANGRPVKGCATEVLPGMEVRSLRGARPALPTDDRPLETSAPRVEEVQVLVVGGGPAGISAAQELGRYGIRTLLLDDKHELGGKLGLQTHNFFGSVAECWAGTRGVEIGRLLAAELAALPSVEVWLRAVAVGVFGDGIVGVAQGERYRLVRPELLLVAAGAREKALAFPGSDLPGVYGAGAFQTLVNRDRVRASERLFVLGGGNVGLIGAYHALQAGTQVVGLVEAAARCGGYRVHEDKLRRLGVPIWTRHTVVRAEGREAVEAAVVAAVDEQFRPIPGSERRFRVDTLLLAVGLAPVNELAQAAERAGLPVITAGDAREIAEASAALFSGRLAGREAARFLGLPLEQPLRWAELALQLKSRPGEVQPRPLQERAEAIQPLLRCDQPIPCDPCVESCPHGLITMPGGILGLPEYAGGCQGCLRCVLACPGLAIVLLQRDYDPERALALLTLPYEFLDAELPLGATVQTVDGAGELVGEGRVLALRAARAQDHRRLVQLEVPWAERMRVAGFRVQTPESGEPLEEGPAADAADDTVVCRCERVARRELVAAIEAGVRDMNQLKALTRAGMGGCGGKTCGDLVRRLFAELGVAPTEIEGPSQRPLVAELPLSLFAAAQGSGRED